MLILSRRRDERLRVMVDGREIVRIEIVDIRGDKVRIGLTAGDEVRFVRGELEVEGAREGKEPSSHDFLCASASSAVNGSSAGGGA